MSRSRMVSAPFSGRLTDAIMAYRPTAYWPSDDGGTPLLDISGHGWNVPKTSVGGSWVHGTVEAVGPCLRQSGLVFGSSPTSIPGPVSGYTSLTLVRNDDASAVNKAIAHRRSIGTLAHVVYFGTGNGITHTVYNLEATVRHNVGTVAIPTGVWHLVMATFDQTTVRTFVARSTGIVSAVSSTALVNAGTWNTETGGAYYLGGGGGVAQLANGAYAHQAYFNDRVLTESDFRHLASIVFS